MDFMFSPEQDQLRASVRSFLDTQAPMSYVREMVDDERGFTDGFWSALVDMGLTELPTLLDMVVVLEETGRRPLPGPYFSAGVLSLLATRHLDGLVAPAGRGSVALEELGHGDPIDRV